MKVRFNNPRKHFTNKFSFDNNTTLGIGNVQPLFCKQLCAGSKISVSFNQLTRLSPLVVPTFARLKQRNDFVFVPISMVMPAFDAFLSRSLINGIEANYIPSSVPCTTNTDLFLSLVKNYAVFTHTQGDTYVKGDVTFKSTYGIITIQNILTDSVPTIQQVPFSYWDFRLDNRSIVSNSWVSGANCLFKLSAAGRMWLTVLRGLGYTLDPEDSTPVSILPLWAFVKAYYDLYYPKRSNPWHASYYYEAINGFYNGHFENRSVGGLDYNMIPGFDSLHSLFGDSHGFDFFATIDDSLASAATDQAINLNSSAGVNLSSLNNTNFSDDVNYNGSKIEENPSGQNLDENLGTYVPSIGSSVVNNHPIGVTADQLRLVDRLWSFVQKSSVVGQSVKDWFSVHLGVKPNEDMFDQSILVESVVNDVSINTVISTAQTTDGSKGDNLGALAGQGYAAKNGSVSFDAKCFGFFMCFTSLVPISGVSCGTEPELYCNTLYEQQLPDFDGLGYEVLNKTSFNESIVSSNIRIGSGDLKGGFGYVPRLSSWKALHNIRSGNFAVNSVKDSLLPYNVDVLPISKLTAGIHWRFPWALHNSFVSFNRMFYNVEPPSRNFGPLPAPPLDDNFMSQTAFDISYTSYLKPLSDSYSVESLGKDLVSVKEQ